MTGRLDECAGHNQWPPVTRAPKAAREWEAILVTGEAGSKSAAHAAPASERQPIYDLDANIYRSADDRKQST